MDALLLSSLLSSRLCHDLISPVSAASNGIEVCQDDPTSFEIALPLMAQSIAMASARLQFYRMAFGYAGGGDGEYGLAEMESLTRQFFADTKIDVVWSHDRVGLSKDVARIILLAALLVAECLVIGGIVKVDIKGSSCVIEAAGERVTMKDPIRLILEGEGRQVEPDAKAAPAFLLMALVEKTNTPISMVRERETSMVVRLSI